MLSSYPAIFIKKKEGYSIIFPNLNHMSTCGNNIIESTEMAIDCLASCLYLLKTENKTLPAPSNIKDITIEEFTRDIECDKEKSFIDMISVDLETYAAIYF